MLSRISALTQKAAKYNQHQLIKLTTSHTVRQILINPDSL